MEFIIGVCIFIGFIIVCILIIKHKIKNIIRDAGFSGIDISDVVKQAKLEAQTTPKSLASMDRIYLKRLQKDFPEVNINELKHKAEIVIYEVIKAFEKADSESLTESKKIFVEEMIREYGNALVRGVKIHNTVLSNYEKNEAVSTITMASSFQYEIIREEEKEIIQDRVKIEYIYVIDEAKLPDDLKVIGLRCPNCGAPLHLLSNKKSCSYCGSEVMSIISRVFTFNSIVRY